MAAVAGGRPAFFLVAVLADLVEEVAPLRRAFAQFMAPVARSGLDPLVVADFAALRPLLMQFVGEGDGAHARRGQVDPFGALGQNRGGGQSQKAEQNHRQRFRDCHGLLLSMGGVSAAY